MAEAEEVSRSRHPGRRVVAVGTVFGLLLGLALRVAPAGAEGALTDADARKAAVKCQALLAKSTAKALGTKLKAFNACTAAALACVQTKAGDAACPGKAAASCTKKLGSAAEAAAKAKTKILANKSCTSLTTDALLGPDGLGFGAIAGSCSDDLGINVCNGLEPIAECLLTSHDVAAGALTGAAAPRTGELLAALPGAPLANTAGLPLVLGCGGQCGAGNETQKPAEKCSKTLGSATAGLARALEASFDACTLALYACVQGKEGDADCITKATATCSKQSGKVAKAVAKVGGAVAKGCASFANLAAAEALNLQGLADQCNALGVAPLDGPAALSACLTAQARCTAADLARSALPRTPEFDAATQLGTLAADLGATCPAAPALQRARTAGKRGLFGSILKVMKTVKRAVPSALGVRTSGGKPPSTGGGGGISKVTGPKRVGFGSLGKYQLKYHGPRSRVGGGSSDAPPPSLIVAVTRSDILFDDHFEIPLVDLPGDGSDVDDEIEIEFADSIPACAFDISFATMTDGAVGDYTVIPQVVDEQITPPSVELVSRGPGGVQQDQLADGANVAVSADGRFVAFVSRGNNLVTPPDGDGIPDVFVRDRCISNAVPVDGCTPTTTKENVDASGAPVGISAAGHVGISDDGRFLAFDAVVFLDGPPDPFRTITYLKDRCISNGQPVTSCTVIVTDVTFETETFENGGFLTNLSSDGRYTVFRSDIIFGQSGIFGIFVNDNCVSTVITVDPSCTLGFPERVTDTWDGGALREDASDGVVSRGGRFVAYRTASSEVFPPGIDTNGAVDVFVRDRCINPLTGNFDDTCSTRTDRVNLTVEGQESVGDGTTLVPSNLALSDDGRYVAFASAADDLLFLNEDTNGVADVFVYDRCLSNGAPVADCTPRAERVNIGPGGAQSNGILASTYPLGMSSDGRLIVFASDATNLVGPAVTQPNGVFQVFLRDRCLLKGDPIPGCTPATTLMSAAPDGGLGTASSDRPAIATTGSTIVFASEAANLLGPNGDTNGVTDIFAKDR